MFNFWTFQLVTPPIFVLTHTHKHTCAQVRGPDREVVLPEALWSLGGELR